MSLITNGIQGHIMVGATQPVVPVQSIASTEGQRQFDEMAYSHTVEGENDPVSVQKEREFYDQLVLKLNSLNVKDVQKLVGSMGALDFKTAPILLHPDLPYLAMEAVRRGLIHSNQAATLLNFWGALQYHEGPNDLEMIEFFTGNATNPRALELIEETLKEGWLDNYTIFVENMRNLPASEQRFLLVPDLQGDFSEEDIERKCGNVFETTISQILRRSVGFTNFNRLKQDGKSLRLIPSNGMMQAFLNAFYDEPVTIMPRIYLSTVMQIRECGLSSTRDMMMAFPDFSGHNRCPSTADGFKAPWYDFSFHDFYHADKASAVTEKYRRAGIAASDALFGYANEAGNENSKGIEQLAIALVDIEYVNFYRHFRGTPKPTDSTFWEAIDRRIESQDQKYRGYLVFRRHKVPVPYEAFPLSEENKRRAIEVIYSKIPSQDIPLEKIIAKYMPKPALSVVPVSSTSLFRSREGLLFAMGLASVCMVILHVYIEQLRSFLV